MAGELRLGMRLGPWEKILRWIMILGSVILLFILACAALGAPPQHHRGGGWVGGAPEGRTQPQMSPRSSGASYGLRMRMLQLQQEQTRLQAQALLGQSMMLGQSPLGGVFPQGSATGVRTAPAPYSAAPMLVNPTLNPAVLLQSQQQQGGGAGVVVPFSLEERQVIRAIASQRGLSEGEFVRRVVVSAIQSTSTP